MQINLRRIAQRSRYTPTQNTPLPQNIPDLIARMIYKLWGANMAPLGRDVSPLALGQFGGQAKYVRTWYSIDNPEGHHAFIQENMEAKGDIRDGEDQDVGSFSWVDYAFTIVLAYEEPYNRKKDRKAREVLEVLSKQIQQRLSFWQGQRSRALDIKEHSAHNADIIDGLVVYRRKITARLRAWIPIPVYDNGASLYF